MAGIEQLRYLRLGLAEPAALAGFVERVVGLEPVAAPEGLWLFRSDDRDHTLALHESAAPQQALGLEVREAADLDALAAACAARGIDAQRGSPEDCAARRCHAMLAIRPRGAFVLELVHRPQHSGWRYHGPRDAGITGFHSVVLTSTEIEADILFWTEALGARIVDRVGAGVYLALDARAHHRVLLLAGPRDGVLEMRFALEGFHNLMQNHYALEALQAPLAHGPGRNPASGEAVLGFRAPGPVLFGYVADGTPRGPEALPRQFAFGPAGFCAWGSPCNVPEYGGGDGR